MKLILKSKHGPNYPVSLSWTLEEERSFCHVLWLWIHQRCCWKQVKLFAAPQRLWGCSQLLPATDRLAVFTRKGDHSLPFQIMIISCGCDIARCLLMHLKHLIVVMWFQGSVSCAGEEVAGWEPAVCFIWSCAVSGAGPNQSSAGAAYSGHSNGRMPWRTAERPSQVRLHF